ncbi:hypothetical protein Ctha_1431 [Chloroherpeton thalassium ATCC 35110]|uniref:Uncharacterized protein n=2 Tax=Chloroherpeton thalassium TaxID=100716 RepID=B3QRU1_CHLT3|nr:hypothetical protein Ctha_1431 [Chloroherpeton thalassium ATCC 35110]
MQYWAFYSHFLLDIFLLFLWNPTRRIKRRDQIFDAVSHYNPNHMNMKTSIYMSALLAVLFIGCGEKADTNKEVPSVEKTDSVETKGTTTATDSAENKIQDIKSEIENSSEKLDKIINELPKN